jgi:hypothetical protein
MLVRTALLALGMLCLGTIPASAGGDGYDATAEDGSGPVFFGVARDTRGLGVSGVEVMLRVKESPPVTLKTNILGMYRIHVGTAVAPGDIEVTCSKPGYKVASVVRRPSQENGRVNETNCTLQRL